MNTKITRKPSPNFNPRPDGIRPSIIVLHYTGMKTMEEALQRLRDQSAQVSCHYLVDRDGTVMQLVDERERAWHAGKSFWRGMGDVNSHSIGIEMVNMGHEYGYKPFSVQQVHSVVKLCQGAMERHNISPANVVGHSDVAPMRKQDPGELFDWQLLALHGVGLWPEPQDSDYDQAEHYFGDGAAAFEALLYEYGYDNACDLKSIVVAFHRHFYRRIFGRSDRIGEIDRETIARLCCLLRLRKNAEQIS